MTGGVLGIGSALFDLQFRCAAFPEEDTKLRADASLQRGGGPCATAVVAASVLGVPAAFIGVCGDDAFGRFILQDFAKYGVDTSRFRVRAGASSAHAAVMLNTAGATRTCVWFPGTMAPLTPEEAPPEAVRQAAALHLDGHQLAAAIPAAQLARQLGIPVSLDAGAVYPGIRELLPWVDLLIPSEEFACKLTGRADPEEAAREMEETYQPRLLAVTQGVRGGFLCRAGALTRYPAYPVEAVDTNGCGDVFHGAFLAAYLRGWPPLRCAKFASAASAIKCSAPGGRDSIPDFASVLAFLRARGETEYAI